MGEILSSGAGSARGVSGWLGNRHRPGKACPRPPTLVCRALSSPELLTPVRKTSSGERNPACGAASKWG